VSKETDIVARAEFYKRPDVARALSKHGVPKDKKSLLALISMGTTDKSTINQDLVDSLGFVVFAVHPQQINVRDKQNGRIIAVISR